MFVLLCETTVTELLRDEKGKSSACRRIAMAARSMRISSILAEGVNGLVGQRSGLRPELKPDTVALAVKEMHFLPPEVIESPLQSQRQ